MIKIIQKILNILFYITMLIIVIYIVIIGYNRYVKKEQILSINNYYLFKIASGSMEDKINTGDYIIVKRSNNYKVGDVVTYKESNHYITHRITKINGNEITTRGDANNSDDNPIKKDQILGKMVFRAYIITFISNNKIFISVLFIIWIILGAIFDKKKSVI